MPACFLKSMSPFVEEPRIDDAALAGLQWSALGEGVESVTLARDERRTVALARTAEGGFVPQFIAGADLSHDYVLVLPLRGGIEFGDGVVVPALDFFVTRPRDDEDSYMLDSGTLALVVRTGTKSKQMPGNPLTVDLTPYVAPLQPKADAASRLQSESSGEPGWFVFRQAQHDITAGLYREQVVHEPYRVRLGHGGGVGLILSGEHYDGRSSQKQGSVYVLGPRDRIASQNRTETWMLSCFFGDAEDL